MKFDKTYGKERLAADTWPFLILSDGQYKTVYIITSKSKIEAHQAIQNANKYAFCHHQRVSTS